MNLKNIEANKRNKKSFKYRRFPISRLYYLRILSGR